MRQSYRASAQQEVLAGVPKPAAQQEVCLKRKCGARRAPYEAKRVSATKQQGFGPTETEEEAEQEEEGEEEEVVVVEEEEEGEEEAAEEEEEAAEEEEDEHQVTLMGSGWIWSGWPAQPPQPASKQPASPQIGRSDSAEATRPKRFGRRNSAEETSAEETVGRRDFG